MKTIDGILNILVISALAAVPLCGQADDSFDARYIEALEQAKTPSGKVYDRTLGEFSISSPGVKTGIDNCLEDNHGSHKLYGMYVFDETKGGYQVVLQPDDSFSRCFASVLEGMDVPEPPSRPYLNPVTYTGHSAASGEIRIEY